MTIGGFGFFEFARGIENVNCDCEDLVLVLVLSFWVCFVKLL